jgi:hypothetical protein
VQSQSPMRAPGEGAVWPPSDFWANDDGFQHPEALEWRASRGSAVARADIVAIATIDITQEPDRVEDVQLAKIMLANADAAIAARGSVTPPVSPTPVPGPVVSPVPAPAPVNPPGTINVSQLIQWGKDLVSILGTIATWATAAHGILGQFLPGTTGVVVPGTLATATTLFTAHNVHQKNVAQKQLVKFSR